MSEDKKGRLLGINNDEQVIYFNEEDGTVRNETSEEPYEIVGQSFDLTKDEKKVLEIGLSNLKWMHPRYRWLIDSKEEFQKEPSDRRSDKKIKELESKSHQLDKQIDILQSELDDISRVNQTLKNERILTALGFLYLGGKLNSYQPFWKRDDYLGEGIIVGIETKEAQITFNIPIEIFEELQLADHFPNREPVVEDNTPEERYRILLSMVKGLFKGDG